MILFKGEVFENKEQDRLIDECYSSCLETLSSGKKVSPSLVIEACDRLYKRVINHEFDDLALPLLKMVDLSYERFLEMASLFSKEGLEAKCKMELGEDYLDPKPLPNGTRRAIYPLGILFHIAAGNVDALPAYSLVEGLLAGNINVLKLPTGDGGLSIRLLNELIAEEPRLKEFIYVFDVPSTELDSIRKLVSFADGIVVWGGDQVVKAAREMVPITSKIISWGHKLSFAYVTDKASEADIHNLARQICVTNQVLCSSTQGIFVDTEDMQKVEAFAENFHQILKEEAAKLGPIDLGMAGRNSIQIYTDQLEGKKQKVFKGGGVSVIVKDDSELELSYMFRSVFVKPLPRKNIISNLKKHGNHLQSCALLCGDDERDELAGLLATAGLVRLTRGNSARMFLAEAHDGTYALREYTRIVEIDP